jgi:6-phosphogluconolactonase
MIIEQEYDTIEAAAAALADMIAGQIRDAVECRGEALIAVSGGRTPRYVFESLHQRQLPWEKVTVTLTDERWVMPTHEQSNERLVWHYLLKDAAAAARFVPLFGGEATPQQGHDACERRLQSLKLPFDAVYLGMGEDGHFASLFPGSSAVQVDNGLCVPVPEAEGRLPRMSLTAPAVLNAQHIYLLFSGATKYAQYQKALQKGDPLELPLRLVVQQTNVPVTVLYVP